MNTRHLAHASDPETSKVAAEKQDTTLTHIAMVAIVDLIDRYGPLTSKELEQSYRIYRGVKGWPELEVKTITKRASELKTKVGVLEAVTYLNDKDEVKNKCRDGATVLRLGMTVDDARHAINEHMRKK